MQYTICALYKFVHLGNHTELRQPFTEAMEKFKVCGTLLLAHEGINGTIAAPGDGIEKMLAYLESDERLKPITFKLSYSEELPFKRSKVKLKKEIVTMGIEDIDPRETVGTYVKPQDWNALISDPEVVLVDTRNDYEYEIGTFKDALNPDTESFREFPEYVAQNLDPKKHKKVAMFCTGGIRCEKSTAFMKREGFEEVYHLEGGILKYLEEVETEKSLWEGECFVFDERVAVNQELEKGSYELCHACRFPITEENMQHEKFELGVSCHKCSETTSEEDKARYRERQRQIELAKTRNEKHIGGEVTKTIETKRAEKKALREAQQAEAALKEKSKV